MTRLQLDQDILPLSDFRANAAALLEQVRETKRPLVITQHGRSAAVLLDVSEYERMLTTLELLQGIQTAEQQTAEGQGIPQQEIRKKAVTRFKK